MSVPEIQRHHTERRESKVTYTIKGSVEMTWTCVTYVSLYLPTDNGLRMVQGLVKWLITNALPCILKKFRISLSISRDISETLRVDNAEFLYQKRNSAILQVSVRGCCYFTCIYFVFPWMQCREIFFYPLDYDFSTTKLPQANVSDVR